MPDHNVILTDLDIIREALVQKGTTTTTPLKFIFCYETEFTVEWTEYVRYITAR